MQRLSFNNKGMTKKYISRQIVLKKLICVGWKIFVIGVFLVSFGGVIESQLGIIKKQAKCMSARRNLLISKIGSKIQTYWTLGSVLRYGRSPQWAGPMSM